MKLLMLLICMICATDAMAQRSTVSTPSVLLTDVATTGQTQPVRKNCQPNQSFSPIKTTEFAAIAGYDRSMSFPPDHRQDWKAGVEGAFACAELEPPMKWQAPGIQALETMRLLPSYPSSNNPSVLSSGWRKFNAE